jgi:hypothetical protein
MRVRASRRKVARATQVVGIAAVLAACMSGTAAAAVSSPNAAPPKPGPTKVKLIPVAGTWSGHYGGAFAGTFTLRWRESKAGRLTGSIVLSNPHGSYSISGSVHGRAISFGAVGVGATYTGSVSGKSMSGRYKSPSGGGGWSARKTS